MIFSAAILFGLQAISPPAVAPAAVLPADSKAAYRVHAPPTCADWRAARAGTVEESALRIGIYRLWVLGYVTGFNVGGPDPSGALLGASPRDELWGAIDGYCARNPSHSVEASMRPIAAAYVRRRGEAAMLPPGIRTRRAQAVAVQTCRDWQDDRANDFLRLAYVGIVRGYVSAYNRWGPDPAGDALGTEDRRFIEGFLDAYCAERPQALLISVAARLIDHAAAERAAGRRPPAIMIPRERQIGD